MKITLLAILSLSYVFGQPIGFFQGGFATETIDANSISSGDIGIVKNDNTFGTQYNPGLINERKFTLGLSYNHLTLDRFSNSILVGFRIPPKARASIGYTGTGVKNIIGRNTTGHITENFNWSNHHLFFTFGIKPMSKISIGVKLNVFFQKLIDEVSSTGLGFDVGLFMNPLEKLDIGLTIRNINAKSNWKIKLNDGTMRNYNELYPKVFSIGGHFKFTYNLSLLNQFDFYYFNEIGYIGYEKKIGIEYKFDKLINPIFIRSGINTKNFTLGFSIPINKFIGLNYGLFMSRLNMGNSHVFSWDIQI